MNIDKAIALKVGDTVHCPADRGDRPYAGRVTHVAGGRCVSFNGTPYVWITVRHPNGLSSHVWPSNRLG